MKYSDAPFLGFRYVPQQKTTRGYVPRNKLRVQNIVSLTTNDGDGKM